MTNSRGRIGHDVLMFDIDTALKDQTNDLAVAKNIALQVFEKLIGNMDLYKALCGAHTAGTAGKTPEQVADLLWAAIDGALSYLDKTMIIVDGTDVLEAKHQQKLLQRLSEISGRHDNVKAVAVSRPMSVASPKGAKIWNIEPEDVQPDIVSFAFERLASTEVLQHIPGSQLQSLAERLSVASNGSFAWTNVAVEVVSREKTLGSVSKTIDGLPKSLNEVVDRLVKSIDLQNRDTRQILAWLLVAQRPLLLDEVKALLEIDTTAVQVTERFTDVESDVRKSCGGLVDITDGLVRFRTLAIRHHLMNLSENVKDFSNSSKSGFPFHIQEAAYDLCLRSLAYVKLSLDRQYPLSTEPLTYTQLSEVFEELPLMQYSCRYWLTHFRDSPMHQYPGTHKLPATFKSVLPDSVAHSRLEGTCVRYQYSTQEATDMLQLSLTLRTMVLGDDTTSVLQTLINVSTLRETINVTEAHKNFSRCFTITRKVLGEENELTYLIARKYIDTLQTFTKSTETEEILTYIVQYNKRHFGVSHGSTITYMRRLGDYYTEIKETKRASTIYREIYEVLVSQYGHSHTETQTIYKRMQTVSTREEIESITRQQHTSVERSLEVNDTRRVTSTKDMVHQYERENDVQKAEETMVNYWREISEKSRTTKDVKVQEQQVDATFDYVKFLQRQKRTEEANTILNGLYIDLEKSTSNSDQKITWIQRIGNEMNTMGTTSSARGVFSYLWSHYRTTGQHNTKEAQSVARSLTESATASVTTTSSSEEQESVYREILETHSLTTQTIDETTIKITQQLISTYIRTDRHEEIIELCRDILQRHWPAVLTGQKDIRMPQSFVTETIEIATQLSKSYMYFNSVEEASLIMYGIFTAYRTQPKENIEKLITFAEALIVHYQSVYRWTDALNVYEALYETLSQVYGPTHEKTIKVLYSKADSELKQNRRPAAKASYHKIYTTLRGNSSLAHKDSIRAAQALCRIYEKEQNWDSARDVYSVLWQTFLQKGQEYALGFDFVNQIFDRYLYILEEKTGTDYKTRRGLASEYRQTCNRFYGADSERTVNASMKLAQLDEQDEAHKAEAVSIYESILTLHQQQKISGPSISIIVGNVRRRLAQMYSAMGVTHEQAQTLYSEEYDTVRSKHGVSHTDSLVWLNLIIACHMKRNNADDKRKAVERLQTISTEIMLNETDSQKLYASSRDITNIYNKNNITEPSAADFANELRRHAVSGQSSITSLKGKTVPRRFYTFIVGMLEGIHGGQFSVIMSELMTESLLTDAFLKAKQKDASFESIFSTGTRLRAFLKSKSRKEYTQVDANLLAVFNSKVVGKSSVDQAAVRQYFDIVLSQIDSDSHDLNVLRISYEAMQRAFKENQFSRGYSLAFIADRYAQFCDGYQSQGKIELAFQICMMLNGHGVKMPEDAKLQQDMRSLSGTIMHEVLKAAKAIQLNFVALPLTDLNILVGILGQQKNYTDLEVSPHPTLTTHILTLLQWILSDMWSARHSQPSWTANQVVTIGRRLVECRFSMGDRASALELLEDICYNLRRVWGPLDKTTLDFEALRAQMYNSTGHQAKVMLVYEEILAHLVSDELDMDQVTASEEAAIAAKYMQELRIAFLRNGAKFPKGKDEQTYDDLYHIVVEQVGKEKAWTSNKVDDVNKWAGGMKSFKDDGSGGWRGVEKGKWEFMAGEASKVKHTNALRRRSARYSGDWSANGSMNGQGNGRVNVSSKVVPMEVNGNGA